MRKLLFIELFRRFITSGNLKRKLGVLLAGGFIAFLLVSALVIWAGIASINYVTNLAQDKRIGETLQGIERNLDQIPAIKPIGCWGQVQNLFVAEVWLEKPISESVNSLRIACFENRHPVCAGDECKDVSNKEGSTT